MEAAAKTGLSVLITLLGWFQDGLTKLEKKEYPAAVAAMTKVIDHQACDAMLRRRAWICRAAALGGEGQIEKAKADLVLAIGEESDVESVLWVFGELARTGVDPARFLPTETPAEAFLAVQKLAAARDMKGLRRRLAGDLAVVNSLSEQMAALSVQDHAQNVAGVFHGISSADAETGSGAKLGTACVAVTLDDGRLVLTLGMVAAGDQWCLASVEKAAKREVAKVSPEVEKMISSAQAAQMRIVRALFTVAAQNGGALPERLEELRGELGAKADVLEFTDPSTGRKLPLLYRCPGTTDAVNRQPEQLVLATPKAIEGMRVVTLGFSETKRMPEEEFQKRAKEQGWVVDPAAIAAKEEKLKREIDRLVAQLGDRDGGKRKEAYQSLKARGREAVRFLEPYGDHPDPEVRMSVRELLKSLAAPEPAPAPAGVLRVNEMRGLPDFRR